MEDVYSVFDKPTTNGPNWSDRVAVVRQCVAKLSETLRKAMNQVYEQGHTLEQAAENLDSTFEAIGQRLTRARQQVRRCVSQRSEGW